MTVSPTQVQNVKLGSCNVMFGTTDLGLTKGGVKVSISTQTKTITVDQFGQTIMNEYIMGRSGTVSVPMAESDLTKLAAVIPGATLVTGTPTTKLKLKIPTAVGTSLVTTALPLVLHPTALASTDVSQDVTIPLANVTANITFEYQAENERIYSVEFTMFPDPTSGLMLTIGDTTVVG